MKAMALGEVAAFLLGPIAAVGVVLSISQIGFPLKACAFLLTWYLTTSVALRFVHWGYEPKKRDSAQ